MTGKRTLDPLEYEIQEARAMALGDAGRKVERAMLALQTKPEDSALIDAAAVAVWEWMIVRESLAFFDHAAAMATYGIPPRVLARVGAVTSKPTRA